MVVDPVGERAGRPPHRGDPLRGARLVQHVVRFPAAMGVQAAVAQQLQPRMVRGDAAGPGGEQVARDRGRRALDHRRGQGAQAGGEVLAAPLVVDRGAEPRDLVRRPPVAPARDQQAVSGDLHVERADAGPAGGLVRGLVAGEPDVAVRPEDLARAELGLQAWRAAPASVRGRPARRPRGDRSSRPCCCRRAGRRRTRRRPPRTPRRPPPAPSRRAGPRVLPPPLRPPARGAAVRPGRRGVGAATVRGVVGLDGVRRRPFRSGGAPRARRERRHLAGAAHHQEVGDRAGVDDARDEHVDPDVAEHPGGRVGAHQLDEEPAERVARDVDGESPPVPEPEPPVRPHDEGGDEQVPQQLVEERGMHDRDRGVVDRDAAERVGDARGRVDPAVDLQPPRQRRRAAVELLVEPVAQTPDRLRGDDAGRDGVGEERQRHVPAPAADPRPDRAERDRPPDPQPAVPDLQRVDRVALGAEVGLPVRGDVVEPAPDQAERHGEHRDVRDRAGLAPARDEPLLTPQHRDDDARDDADRVRADRHRTEHPHATVRAVQVRQQRGRHLATVARRNAITRSGRPPTARPGARTRRTARRRAARRRRAAPGRGRRRRGRARSAAPPTGRAVRRGRGRCRPSIRDRRRTTAGRRADSPPSRWSRRAC